MITIIKDANADSRTCNRDNHKITLSKEQLKVATDRHIEDVGKGMKFFADLLIKAGKDHDNTKKSSFDEFYDALISDKVKNSDWYEGHSTKERHHLIQRVPENVTLIDVFEHLVDCVMAGLGRSGEVFDIDIPREVLVQAHENTVSLLKKNVKVKEDKKNILDESVEDE